MANTVAAECRPLGSGLLRREDQGRILVAGTHRSGTTWLGGILAAGQDCLLVNEPFSKERGIIGVRHWFPLCTAENPLYAGLIDRFFLTRHGRYRPDIPGRSRLRALVRLVLPDAAQRQLAAARAHPPRRLIVKDPLASMAAEHLIAAFGFKVVFMVKHPYAFYDSLLRVGWERSLPLEDCWQQAFGRDGRRRAAAVRDPAERAGIVWRMVYEHALALRQAYPRHCVILRHEDLCRDPSDLLAGLLGFLDMPFSEGMRDYALRTSTGETVRPDALVVHELKRNSAALPERWREGVTEQDRATLRRVTEPVRERIYPESGPQAPAA